MGQAVQETSNLKDKAREVSKLSLKVASRIVFPEPLTLYDR